MDVTDHCARSIGNLNRNPYCSCSHSTPISSWTMKRNEREGEMGCGWRWEVVRRSVVYYRWFMSCCLLGVWDSYSFCCCLLVISSGWGDYSLGLCDSLLLLFILSLILLWWRLCISSIRLLFFYWAGVAFCYLHHLWFTENEDCILKLFILTLSVIWNHCPLVVQSLNAYDMESSGDLCRWLQWSSVTEWDLSSSVLILLCWYGWFSE